MAFDDIIRGMDATLFAVFGERGILNGALLVQVVVEGQNAERFKNFEFALNELQTIFSIRRASVDPIRVGDRIEIDRGKYVVDQIIQSDAFVVDAIVRAAN
jgi:hypothetical protein